MLERLDPGSGRIDEAARVGSSPWRLGDGGNGRLWIANQAGGVVAVGKSTG